ncbi:MAG: hypothetical protein II659_07945 [Bacteroidales bacterium]|nr:hypothetical protein [Bacteroidales bacterium]
MKDMKFFGTNEGKNRFVIFEIDIEGAPNAYIWVFVPDDDIPGIINIEPITRIYSYINHDVSRFCVREEDAAEIIDKALEFLSEFPEAELSAKLKAFNDRFDSDEYYRRRWENEFDDLEQRTAESIEEARAGSGLWPWTPHKAG